MQICHVFGLSKGYSMELELKPAPFPGSRRQSKSHDAAWGHFCATLPKKRLKLSRKALRTCHFEGDRSIMTPANGFGLRPLKTEQLGQFTQTHRSRTAKPRRLRSASWISQESLRSCQGALPGGWSCQISVDQTKFAIALSDRQRALCSSK